MKIIRSRQGLQKNKTTKIIVGIMFVCIVGVLFGFYSYNKPSVAIAEENKKTLKDSFSIYDSLTQTNINYIKSLNTEYQQLTSISAKNANEISNIGNNITNHIKVLRDQKSQISNSQNDKIKSLHIKMLNNLLLQELYLTNSVETVQYFNCMIEKKANFNYIWTNFNANNEQNSNPTLETITNPESINYFKQYSITAKKSSDSLNNFTNCFEDKFYIYKDSVYDNKIQESQTKLDYISFTYNKFADLLTGEGNEIELIATIEEIETFKLNSIIVFTQEFDKQFIIKPTVEIFNENVKTSINPSYSEIKSQYQEIINQL